MSFIFSFNGMCIRKLLPWVLLLITAQGCQSVSLCSESAGETKEQEYIVWKLKKEIDHIQTQSNRASTSHGPAVELKKEDGERRFFVLAHERKNYSGIKLVKDMRYRFRIEKFTHGWFDAGIDAHPIQGWGNHANTFWRKTIRLFGRLFSSSWDDDLMVLQGVVEGPEKIENGHFSFATNTENVEGLTNGEVLTRTFTAPGTGELYVFANDAQLDYFYRNNCGYLILTVEQLP